MLTSELPQCQHHSFPPCAQSINHHPFPFSTCLNAQDASGGVGGLKESGVLYSWLSQRVALYLAALRARLPAVTEGANLASVLEHCMYCASSLARVGLDFSGLLQPVFEVCSLRLLGSHLGLAVEGFARRLEAHKWVALPGGVMPKPKPAAAAGAAGEGESEGGAAGGKDADGKAAAGAAAGAGGEDLAPPYALMEYVPLAVLVNGLLGALNELRHCALASLAAPMAGLLQAALEQAAGAMVHYKHSRALAANEATLFRGAVESMGETVVPYVNGCFQRIFPGAGVGVDAAAVVAVLQEALQE